MGEIHTVPEGPDDRGFLRFLSSILSIATLLVAVGQFAFFQSVPWPPVLEIGPVGVWTPLVLAALLSVAVLLWAVRGLRAGSASRANLSFAVLAGVTFLATIYGVVVPYLQSQGVLIAVYPGILLSVILASVFLGTHVYATVVD